MLAPGDGWADRPSGRCGPQAKRNHTGTFSFFFSSAASSHDVFKAGGRSFSESRAAAASLVGMADRTTVKRQDPVVLVAVVADPRRRLVERERDRDHDRRQEQLHDGG